MRQRFGLDRPILVQFGAWLADTLYARVNAILQRDMPVTFLFPYFETFAVHRKVRGLRSPDRASPIGAIREIWIDESGDTR